MKKLNGFLLQLTGVLFFGALFALAWTFYKERMLNYDPAFFSFRILFDKDYDVELGRWGSVVSQALPLWFLKAGCSLETFLRVYSVSFILVYYLVFLIITLGLKNTRAAIVLMITLCLAFRHAFYYSTAELYQGLAISVLVLALVFPGNPYATTLKKNIAFFFSLVLIYVLSYYHQILIFPLVFIFLYHIISEKKYKDKYLLGALAFSIIWFFIRIKFLTATTYEKDKIPKLSVFFEQLGSFTELPSYKFMIDFTGNFLLPLLALNAVVVVALVVTRKWLLLAFCILFNAGFVYLNIVTYAGGESALMYENYLTALGLFCAVPLSSLLMKIKNVRILWAAVFIVLLVNVQAIYTSRFLFSDRVAYLERITSFGRQFHNKKYIIDYRNFAWKYGWVPWALPFETLLFSSMQSPDSAVTVCMADPISQYDSIAAWKNIFIGPSWSPIWFWTNELDHRFFNLPHGDYKKITTSQLDSGFTDTAFNSSTVSITPKLNFIELTKEPFTIVPVEIKNTSGRRINAIPDSPNPIAISYHVYDEKGEKVLWDGFRTELETDIYESGRMGVLIKNDLPKGIYTIEFDFITEGLRWWNINARARLKVD
jgi:hypothetical protein